MTPANRLRRTDNTQLWIVGVGLLFLLIVVAGNVLAQTQEGINATVFERMNGILYRLDRMENYQTASIVALIGNFVAHLVQIRSRKSAREQRRFPRYERDDDE